MLLIPISQLPIYNRNTPLWKFRQQLPLGGASPQFAQSVSEEEEDLPVAMDCTTLALAAAAQSQSTSLLAENQDCGVEPRNCHEGTDSAAPVAQNEFSSTSAMSSDKPFHVYANQTQGQVEADNPTPLLVENSVSGVEVKAVDEGSAASVPNPEKWSHEAIVARSNLRPERMQKLKVVANSGQNPGFEYLQECWDDPAKADCDQEVAGEISAVGCCGCGWGAD